MAAVVTKWHRLFVEKLAQYFGLRIQPRSLNLSLHYILLIRTCFGFFTIVFLSASSCVFVGWFGGNYGVDAVCFPFFFFLTLVLFDQADLVLIEVFEYILVIKL